MSDILRERARRYLVERSQIFTANKPDDVEYVASYMTSFAESILREAAEWLERQRAQDWDKLITCTTSGPNSPIIQGNTGSISVKP